MFGVCDGHGHYGKEASGLVKQVLPAQLETCVSYTEAFLNTDAQLNKTVDTNLSGTTVVVVIFEGTKLICLNSGDSRAIKVSLNEQSYGQLQTEATPLSEDHKPELEVEAKRILQKGGRIQAFKDDQTGEQVGPQRVWLADQDLPGLAMSRSLGDQVAHSVGVSSLPESKEFYLTRDDKFVVIATDGVWEFLSNEDVASIILPFFLENQPEAAANALVRHAHQRWRQVSQKLNNICRKRRQLTTLPSLLYFLTLKWHLNNSDSFYKFTKHP